MQLNFFFEIPIRNEKLTLGEQLLQRLKADNETVNLQVSDLRRNLEEAGEASRQRSTLDALVKSREFEIETMKTRLTESGAELATLKASAAESEKREDEWKRKFEDKDKEKGDVSSQLTAV